MPREYRLLQRALASLFLISFVVSAQGFTPIRVNCGGNGYVDPQGVVWAADNGYRISDSTFSTTANITGTLSPGLYQTERYGKTVLYLFAVPNGTYTVNLRFAEIYWTAAGQRTFSVAINQQWVLANFDIVAQSGGPNHALDKPFTVTATSGMITIQLTAGIDNAVISGIEILSQSSPTQVTGNPPPTGNAPPTGNPPPPTGTTTVTPPPTGPGTTPPAPPVSTGSGSTGVIRVSSGGAQYTDPQGTVWSADNGYWGASNTYSTAAPITGTTSQALYQNERWGTGFGYKFPVPNGAYTVNLKFAENYWTTPGRRLFDVAINGQWMLANFDILAQAGGPHIALDKAFNIAVTNGAVMIQFTSVVDNAKVDAIEILPQVTTVSLTPSFASLKAGGSSQFNATVTGASNTGVQWSITPPIGTISSSGLYGAPSSIFAAQTVTVMATSLADSTKTASAAVSLVPTIPTTILSGPPPITSVSPNQTSLTSSQTQQFSVVGLPSAMGGATSITVGWAINPSAGSITPGGLYFAPGTISTQQTVVVTAMNAANSAVLGTASVTLTPPVAPPPPAAPAAPTAPTPPAAPAGLTATPGIGQVTLNWTGSSGASSYNVKRATMSGGPYTTVGNGVTTTGFVNTGLTSGTTYYYVVSALNAGGEGSNSGEANAQPTAPVPPAPTGLTTNEGNGQVTLSWTASPGATSYNVKLGTVSGGPYTTVGSATTTSYLITGLNNGTTYYYVVSAVNASGESPNSGQVNGHPIAPPTPTTIQLPLEVYGPAGTSVSVSFNVASGSNISGQMQVWLQIHGLKYQTEASLQVNSGNWIPINDSTVTLLGKAAAFGGIGGGFATLKLTINLPAGSIQQGQNTLTFRFNGTDGITSGFRVLNFNVLAVDGSQLIPASNLTQDDPSNWQPTLNTAADIQAGQALWKSASLTAPGLGPIHAKCGDCHTQDGRDLKYFNYSNLSIRTRAMFHGLTAQQGDQIASYIRSLNTPAPANARPWNPPYQPGPGMDSQPVTNWSAGAGLDAVLDNDAAMLPYLMPGGSTANWAKTAYLNQRELPIPLQMLDWNRWLPTVHPLDAFGSQFTTNELNTGYTQARSVLKPNDPVSYANLAAPLGPLYQWMSSQTAFYGLVRQPQSSTAWNDPRYDQEIYSVALWLMVKNWELNQEFGLEGMARVVFGAQSPTDRAWMTSQPFISSPTFMQIPRPSPGIGNGTTAAHVYLSYIWYHTQLILNDGNGTASGTTPIDWGYSISFIGNDLTWDPYPDEVPRTGVAGLLLEFMIKNLQAEGINDSNPYFMVVFPAQVSAWSEVSSSQKVQLMNAWVSNWIAAAKPYTTQQLFTADPGTSPIASPTFSSTAPGSFTGDLAWALPELRYQGVDPSLLNQVASWASGIWPKFNWIGDINKTCTAGNLSEVKCQ